MFGLVARSDQNMASSRGKPRPWQLVPFIPNANIGQQYPGRIGFPLQLPSERSADGAMSSVATDEILATVGLGRTGRTCDLTDTPSRSCSKPTLYGREGSLSIP